MPPRGGGPESNSGGRRHVFGTVSGVSTWRKLRRTARVCASLAVVVLPSALKLPLYRTFFGYRILFTHYLDVATIEQRTRPIRIGDDCMLGAAVRIAPGAQIPDCCVVGMGAVVTRAFADSHALIAGCPAAIVRSLRRDGAYFARTRGWIGRYAAPATSDDAR